MIRNQRNLYPLRKKRLSCPLCSMIKSIRNTIDKIIILLGQDYKNRNCAGLTEADIDLGKQLINVDHQLLKIAT